MSLDQALIYVVTVVGKGSNEKHNSILHCTWSSKNILVKTFLVFARLAGAKNTTEYNNLVFTSQKL